MGPILTYLVTQDVYTSHCIVQNIMKFLGIFNCTLYGTIQSIYSIDQHFILIGCKDKNYLGIQYHNPNVFLCNFYTYPLYYLRLWDLRNYLLLSGSRFPYSSSYFQVFYSWSPFHPVSHLHQKWNHWTHLFLVKEKKKLASGSSHSVWLRWVGENYRKILALLPIIFLEAVLNRTRLVTADYPRLYSACQSSHLLSSIQQNLLVLSRLKLKYIGRI